jgi:tetraacyldisaccharide 4'-kinase
MAQALQRAWMRRGALACLLLPLSLVFGVLAGLRRSAYRAGLLQRERMPVPVIVVGSVLVGGSGKTPVVMALLDHLAARGISAGVVSRGYGRTAKGCIEVTADSNPQDAGDEPLLVARSCASPVFVASTRAEAARALLKAYPSTQVIVCDDGLQHYALARDIEICVFDERGTGNGWLLPAGPLREHWPRPVDLVLHSGRAPGIEGFVFARKLALMARRPDGSRIALDQLHGKPLLAVAAIARPEAFFAMLRQQRLHLTHTVSLPDHDDFSKAPPSLLDAPHVLCTEKDAVKLWRLRPDAWAIPLELSIDADFWPAFDSLLDAKLSSMDGSQTS